MPKHVMCQGDPFGSEAVICQVYPSGETLTVLDSSASWMVIRSSSKHSIRLNCRAQSPHSSSHDTYHIRQSSTPDSRLVSDRSNNNIIPCCENVKRQPVQQSREGVERFCCTISKPASGLALCSSRLQTHG